MDLDDPVERRAFRRSLSELGPSEVRYRLAARMYSERKAAVVEQWLSDVATGATLVDDLRDLTSEIKALKVKFVHGGSMTGLFLPDDGDAEFERLFVQAKALVDDRLGRSNDFSQRLVAAYNDGVGGMSGGPSLHCVETVAALLRGAVQRIERTPQTRSPPPSVELYVHAERIREMQDARSVAWDLRRLIQMCVELNAAHERGHYMTVAMIVRAIMDHVPPIFGKATFAQVASEHPNKSIKGSLQTLQNSMRNVSDTWLHQQIRTKESLPSANQVDVRRELDVLLAETVRLI